MTYIPPASDRHPLDLDALVDLSSQDHIPVWCYPKPSLSKLAGLVATPGHLVPFEATLVRADRLPDPPGDLALIVVRQVNGGPVRILSWHAWSLDLIAPASDAERLTAAFNALAERFGTRPVAALVSTADRLGYWAGSLSVHVPKSIARAARRGWAWCRSLGA